MAFESLLSKLETDLRAALDTCITGLVATARMRLQGAQVDIDKERAKALAEIEGQRTNSLAEVDEKRAELIREIEAMRKHKEAQEGRVVLDVGGYRYTTSVQALRRPTGTFFYAYFSGRYAQEVCPDGSIFIDRDGEHFGHVLQYLITGVVAVSEQDASELDINVLRILKREFGFYCVDLYSEQQDVVFAVGGKSANTKLASVERYDAVSGACRPAALIANARDTLGLSGLVWQLHVTGAWGTDCVSYRPVDR